MKCVEEKEGSISLKPKANVEQNLKVKHLWLTCYCRLNMTRLVNQETNCFYRQEFPYVHTSCSVYKTHSSAKQKYFAPIGMLCNKYTLYSIAFY